MIKHNKYFTLMFVPEDNGKTFTIRIPKYVFRSIIIFFIILFSGLLLLLFKSGQIAAKLQVLSFIRTENEKLLKENDQLRLITEKINRLDNISRYLSRFLSTPGYEQNKIENINRLADSFSTDSFISTSSYKPQKYQHNYKVENIGSFPNIYPVEGWITRQFDLDSNFSGNGHQGLDFAAATGTPIKATAPGVVGKIDNDKYFGLIVSIHHDNGFITRYGHCSQILVSRHDRVNRGQTIALVGNTGRSTAPHVHYEVIKDGKFIDPSKHILVSKN